MKSTLKYFGYESPEEKQDKLDELFFWHNTRQKGHAQLARDPRIERMNELIEEGFIPSLKVFAKLSGTGV